MRSIWYGVLIGAAVGLVWAPVFLAAEFLADWFDHSVNPWGMF